MVSPPFPNWTKLSRSWIGGFVETGYNSQANKEDRIFNRTNRMTICMGGGKPRFPFLEDERRMRFSLDLQVFHHSSNDILRARASKT